MVDGAVDFSAWCFSITIPSSNWLYFLGVTVQIILADCGGSGGASQNYSQSQCRAAVGAKSKVLPPAGWCGPTKRRGRASSCLARRAWAVRAPHGTGGTVVVQPYRSFQGQNNEFQALHIHHKLVYQVSVTEFTQERHSYS